MLSHSLAKLSAKLPSSLKYHLATIRPLYSALMRLGEPLVTVQTMAGPLRWHIDHLTSQEYLLGTYEPYMQEAFMKFVKGGATVYDVGAHSGYHSLFSSMLVGPNGRVVAFEPNPLNRASIDKQLSMNPGARVVVSSYALSDRCGLSAFDTSHSSSQGRLSHQGDLNVEVRQLDFLITHEGFPAPDVIKIDVEGYEEQVLRGGMRTIEKYRPVILCDRNDDTTFPMVRDLLVGIGYEVIDGSPIIGSFTDRPGK